MTDESSEKKRTPPPNTKGMKIPIRRPPAGPIDMMISTPSTDDQRIVRAVNEYQRKTIQELGGLRAINTGQRSMILLQARTLELFLLAHAQLVSDGWMFDEKHRPHPALAKVESYINTFRRGQVALGLVRARVIERKRDPMAEVLDEYRKRKNPPMK